MLLLKHLIETKLSNLSCKNADPLWNPFKALIKTPASDLETWPKLAKHCLKNILSVIAQNEKISPANGGGDQTFYQYHLPDKITGILQELEVRLYSQEIPHYPIDQEFWTIAFLLFKATEWTVWNYEGTSPYPEFIDKRAASALNSIMYTARLWGDLDEIWFALLEKLPVPAKFNPSDFSECLFGWSNYYGAIIIDKESVAFKPISFDIGPPESMKCMFGAQMLYFDQTEVRVEVVGEDKQGHSVKSSGKFEREVLTALEQEFGKIE